MASLNIQDIRKSIETNQKQWLIGSLAGLVVMAGVMFALFRPKDDQMAGGGFEPGAGGAPTQPFGPPTAGGPPTAPGMSGAPAPMGTPGGGPVGPPMPGGGPPMPGGGPPMPGGGPPAPGGVAGAPEDPFAAEAAGAEAAKPAEKKKAEPSLYAGVSDPFEPLGAPKVDRARLAAAARRIANQIREQQRQAQLAQLPWLSIYRTGAPGGEGGVPGGQPITQEPQIIVNRRTSGLLYGERALAVLETDGTSAIVQPGDVLVSGGERVQVQRIDRDGMVLRRLDSRQPPIVVPLEASRGTVAGSITGGPMPGYPGSMPGGGPPLGPGGPPMPGGPPLPPL